MKDEIERGYNDTIGLDSISSATLKYCLELMEGEQRKHDAIEEMYKRKSKPSVESCQSDDSDDSHDYHGYQPECAANTHYSQKVMTMTMTISRITPQVHIGLIRN